MNIKEDYDLLVQANKDAKEFIKSKDPNYQLLKETILASIDTD